MKDPKCVNHDLFNYNNNYEYLLFIVVMQI